MYLLPVRLSGRTRCDVSRESMRPSILNWRKHAIEGQLTIARAILRGVERTRVDLDVASSFGAAAGARTSPFRGNGGKVRNRRVSPVPVCPGEGPFTEPRADAQPRRPELVFMPHCRSSPPFLIGGL